MPLWCCEGTHAHMHAYTHLCIQACTHSCTHTYTQMHTGTCTHSHAWLRVNTSYSDWPDKRIVMAMSLYSCPQKPIFQNFLIVSECYNVFTMFAYVDDVSAGLDHSSVGQHAHYFNQMGVHGDWLMQLDRDQLHELKVGSEKITKCLLCFFRLIQLSVHICRIEKERSLIRCFTVIAEIFVRFVCFLRTW